ncbi:F-box/LRR-repeat protein fbxl-1 [Chrysoperla carnea]|uniref:F-box/LRR-repeat protein fbxl-1 n=1 Tax=Chrysoperla carnea TaxID=189513 RepID=UPI001D078809|nr:F-box/LRR-repeat protein fbxl-1 [Chrysoperla carnea]
MEDIEKNTKNGETSSMKHLKRNVNDNDEDHIDAKRKRIFQPIIENDQQIIETNLCNLPNELLISIFSYLDTVDLMDLCLTCERFFDLCYEKSLWKIINIRDINLTDDIFRQYMNFAGPHTEEFHIIGTDSLNRILTFDNLYQIKIKCPNLRALHLENQMLDSVYMFVSVFPSTLKELSLANCSLLNDSYFQRFFAGIDSYFTNLETLILTNCLWFSSHSIMAISKLPKLKFLYLDGCIQLNNFMPYLSLSTRYGFKSLELVDLRRTYVSDSEVSCFNATKTLKALYLEHVPVDSQNNRNTRAILKEDNSKVLQTEFFKTALDRLSNMITEIEQHLENMNTPKSRILKTNFNTLMQDLSKTTIGDACRIICMNVTKKYGKTVEEHADDNAPYLDKTFLNDLKQLTRRVNNGQNEHMNIDFDANFYDNTVLVGLGAAPNVSSVDDRTVHALFNPRSECVHLERVSFRGCQNITNKGLIYLTNASQTISFIDVRGTGVTHSGCLKFQALRPCCELKCDFEI